MATAAAEIESLDSATQKRENVMGRNCNCGHTATAQIGVVVHTHYKMDQCQHGSQKRIPGHGAGYQLKG